MILEHSKNSADFIEKMATPRVFCHDTSIEFRLSLQISFEIFKPAEKDQSRVHETERIQP